MLFCPCADVQTGRETDTASVCLSVFLATTCICGSPVLKSNIIPLRISIASLHSNRCISELPLRAGLKCDA